MSDKKSALDVGLNTHQRIANGFPVEMVGNVEFTSLWDAAKKITDEKYAEKLTFIADPFGGGTRGFHGLQVSARCSCSSKFTGQKCNYLMTPIFEGEAQAALLGAVFYSAISDLRLTMHEKGCSCVDEPDLLELQNLFGGDQND